MRLEDIMVEMNEEWHLRNRAASNNYFKKYKAYKTRLKRAEAEIINVFDYILDKHQELNEKQRHQFKEFTPCVISGFRSSVLDSMNKS